MQNKSLTYKIGIYALALITLPIIILIWAIQSSFKLVFKIIKPFWRGIGMPFRAIDRFIQRIYEAYNERCFRVAVNDMICSNDLLGYTYRQTIFHELD